ncbi:uncharacterized protein J7T54_000304 [Emericellopsis cladophorae]|uniref:Myb-like domain-containing protein n=1 Tax=Emericellopsis cladophorae TaxID=2686198 RepID=A0A9P9XWI4_9HYPO|nr:uncharacterized protein J7T54_000304 [Emericellopsis cladophorae]KAI6779158.1 hypothetical protein J7T54_000304 [Emericellopsis cladophorae]
MATSSQHHPGYGSPSQQQQQQQHHHHQQYTQPQQYRHPVQHQGDHGVLQHEGAHGSPHGLPQVQAGGSVSAAAHNHHQHHHHQHPPHLMMDATRMGHARIEPSHYETSGGMMSPMYQHMAPSTQSQAHQVPNSLKRPRSDSLDVPLHGLHQMGHVNLAGLHQAHLGQTYAQAAGGTASLSLSHPTHHHHRLPDSEPSAKMMRREDIGGAPSVVGQEGMPEPAPRPKGPKLKFTAEDDQLLIELKEQKNLTWKQIADFFPGRSSGTLQVRYCTKLKAKTKQWNPDMDEKLRGALNDYEQEKWRIVSTKLGPGFTPAACRERAEELYVLGEHGEAKFEELASSPEEAETSLVEPTETMYAHVPLG